MSSSVWAGWNYFAEFTIIGNTLCEVWSHDLCIDWADTATFKPYAKAKMFFGKGGQYVYEDKDALYFFPMNDEWRRIEIDHKNLKKIQTNYFTDEKNIYFASLPFSGIKKIWPRNRPYSFLDDIFIYDNKVYYRWALEVWLNGKRLLRDTQKKFGTQTPQYLIYGSIIYIDQWFSLIKLRGVHIPTFRIIPEWYEDKNQIYKRIDGHYGFDFEIMKK